LKVKAMKSVSGLQGIAFLPDCKNSTITPFGSLCYYASC
jgi:hypothetical protein